MGGKALSCETTRLNKDRYLSLYEEITWKICRELGYFQFEMSVIKSYKNKSDFGDLDILMTKKLTESQIISILDPVEIFTNGPVTSIGYKVIIDSEQIGIFQVDLIYCDPQYYSFTNKLMSYDPIGNLLGMLFNALGFKLTNKGLFYKLKDPITKQLIDYILVTSCFENALIILGYTDIDYFVYGNNNFHSLEDIYEFITNSKYFHPEIYLKTENLNHSSRTKFKKRPNIVSFLDYIKDIRPSFNIAKLSTISDKVVKALSNNLEYLTIINKEFFKDRCSKVLTEHQNNLEYRKRFNGKITSELTGLEGKELSFFMEQLINFYGGYYKFKDLILSLTEEGSKIAIKTFFVKYKETEKYELSSKNK